MSQPLRLGISSCLLGQPVRYNGDHKYSNLCAEKLATQVELVSFCPEAAAGFGTPRPPMQLVGSVRQPQLLLVDNPGADLRPQLEAGFQQQLEAFANLDGFILMPRSPSCGLHEVKLHDSEGRLLQERTSGIFASALRQRYPLLPLEQEDHLQDPEVLERFLQSALDYRQLRLLGKASSSKSGGKPPRTETCVCANSALSSSVARRCRALSE